MKIRSTMHCSSGKVLAGIALVLCAATSVRADYQGTVVADHPLAYYPLNLDADANGTAADLSGNNNNGAYVNLSAANKVAGPTQYIPNGVSFDGSSTFVDLSGGNNTALLNFGGAITMEAWVMPDGPSMFGNILAKGYDSANNYAEITLRGNGDGRYFGGSGDGAYGGPETASWTYVVASNDGTNWNLYLNGVLVSKNANTSGAANLSYPWMIGTGSLDGSKRYFRGSICQVALYNYALAPSQVASHYYAGSYGTTNPPPKISADPAAKTLYVGGTARFSVSANSSLPLSYQWFKGAMALSGQTNSTLLLANVQAASAGAYSVVVSNTIASAQSAAATLTILTPGAYAAAVVGDKPLAFYPLDETSGDQAIDYVGGFNGAYQNSPFLGSTGPSTYIPACVIFSGASVDIGNHDELNFTGAVTMEAWVQASSVWTSGIYDIVAKGFSWTPYDEFCLRANANNYNASTVNGGGVGGVSVTTDWTHLVATCDGTNWAIYANGTLVNQAPGTGLDAYSAPWAIGSGSLNGASRYFSGNICEVALYDHALTTAQVLKHYFMGTRGTTNPPPKITTDLAAQSIYVGGNLHLSVGVESAMPLTYKWYKGSTLLTGKTNTTLIVTNVQTSDSGSYSVTVSSQAGSAKSAAATVSVLAPAGYAAAVMADKPVAYYPLNEISGNTATDYASAFNGTYMSFPLLGMDGPSTYIPLCANFNQNSVYLGTHPEMSIGGPITMEAWVQPAVQSGQFYDILAQGFTYSPYNEICLRANGLNLEASCVNGGSVGGIPVTGEWVHLISTCDGTNWMMYVNGALVAQAPGVGPTAWSAPWAIASGTLDGATRYFNGNICQVALYNYALSPIRAMAHYDMGSIGNVQVAPVINADPVSRTIYAGTTVQFGVKVSSPLPLKYQWYKDNTLLPGQTNAALAFSNVQVTDSGSYKVTVSNSVNSATSGAAVLTVIQPGVYGAAIVSDHPMAYYPLNETSGNAVVDYVGGFNGTYIGGPQLGVAGPSSFIASGVAFDGTTQRADLGNPDAMNISGHVTMEAWVQPSATPYPSGNGYIVAHGLGASSWIETDLKASASGFYIGEWKPWSGLGATAPFQTGDVGSTNWVHLVGTYDGTNWNIYRNGEFVASQADSNGALTVNDSPWAIGDSGTGGRGFQGSVSQVAIYKYALSPAQVQAHFMMGQSGIVGKPVMGSATIANNKVVLTGSKGTPNGGYYLLSSTSITAPLDSWSVVATNTFDANGAFTCTNSIDSTSPRFYAIKLR